MELNGVDVELSAAQLPLQGKAVFQRRGRNGGGPPDPAAEEHRKGGEKEPGHTAAKTRPEPAGNGRRAHPVFNLGGFTTLAPALPPLLSSVPES